MGYEYDLNGNVTAVTDAEGRRLAFEYDALGNLTAIRWLKKPLKLEENSNIFLGTRQVASVILSVLTKWREA